jgi:hypothetical protein
MSVYAGIGVGKGEIEKREVEGDHAVGAVVGEGDRERVFLEAGGAVVEGNGNEG